MQKGVYGYKTDKKIREAFGDGDTLRIAKHLAYPKSAEDDFKGVIDDYTDKLCRALESELPALKTEYEHAMEGVTDRMDASDSSMGQAQTLMDDLIEKFMGLLTAAALFTGISKMAKEMKKQTVDAWSDSIKKTADLDVDEDYYDDEFFADETARWEEYNRMHFPELAYLFLGTVTLCLATAYDEQMSYEVLLSNIQKAEQSFQNHADFVASDQSVKLNAAYDKKIFKDSGCDRYVWRTMEDSKVRNSHAELDGRVFSYDGPPLIDGEPMNPGDDYGCRCMAEPVLDLTAFDVPLKDEPETLDVFEQ